MSLTLTSPVNGAQVSQSFTARGNTSHSSINGSIAGVSASEQNKDAIGNYTLRFNNVPSGPATLTVTSGGENKSANVTVVASAAANQSSKP